ncbi:MAG: N-acetylneuraminate synthase [Promethearchaeota archaeon]
MTYRIKVGTKYIGKAEPVYIIAEAGVNHNGDFKLAKQLVDSAKEIGADAVKFQTFKADDLVTSKAEMADYQKRHLKDGASQYEMIKRLELDYDDFRKLKKYCDEKGIQFLSTPHSPSAVGFLDPLVPVFKIASGDLTNLPFLELVASCNKAIILSTGMATLDEVSEAVHVIRDKGVNQLVLMHCVSNYPASLETINLRAMLSLQKAFGVLVGYSDHTIGFEASVAAVALGACVIEKHFTLDNSLPGPDHKASMEPRQFAKLVRILRGIEKALGDGVKKPTESEMKNREVARKSLIARMDIPKGSTITDKMIEIKRPGTGIKPKHLKDVLGKKAKITIKREQILNWEMLE